MSISPDIPSTSSRGPAFAFAALAAAWLLLLVAAPWAVSHFVAWNPLFKAGGLVYLAGRVVCHQRADRSFHAWGVQLPVCARCFGIYAGAVLGAALGSGLKLADFRQATGARAYFAIAAAPTVISVALEILGVWAQTPLVRCIAAVPLGFGVALFVAGHAAEVAGQWRRRRGV